MSAGATAAATPAAGAALAFAGVTVLGRESRSGEDRVLLRAVDWRVQPGEHWAVLGPNGAGKTTVLRTAAGLVEPAAGTVTVLGERHGAPGFRDPRLRIAQIESTPPSLAQQITATEVVVLRAAGPVAVRGERISVETVARARELLTRFGCAALLDRRYGECSQGERQRILLARALMRDPDVLLLDEPTAALDLPGRVGLLQAMERLAADRPRLATVTVTHHPEELASSTTHALLLRDGTVIGAGPVGDTITGPRLSACFGVPVSVDRVGERWLTRARQAAW